MALAFKEVASRCIGSCSNQNVVIKIDNNYVSLTGLLQTVQDIARQTQTSEMTKLLAALVRLIHALTNIAKIQGATISKPEIDLIKNLIKNYKGNCDLYFLLSRQDTPSGVLLSRGETEQLYAKKASAATTVEAKSHYSAVMNDIAMLYSAVTDLNVFLTAASTALNRIETPLSQEERKQRGYGLMPEQRAEKNAQLLRSGTMGGAPTYLYTMGSYLIEVPGMWQGHCIFVIDQLTGLIFIPADIERHGRYVYEAKEKDIAQFDYVYAKPVRSQEQLVTLPRDYAVLPLRMGISAQDLSNEAKEVIDLTKDKLFKPALLAITRAIEYTKDLKIYAKLSRARRIMQAELAQPL
jgi:hypothetical protein